MNTLIMIVCLLEFELVTLVNTNNEGYSVYTWVCKLTNEWESVHKAIPFFLSRNGNVLMFCLSDSCSWCSSITYVHACITHLEIIIRKQLYNICSKGWQRENKEDSYSYHSKARLVMPQSTIQRKSFSFTVSNIETRHDHFWLSLSTQS